MLTNAETRDFANKNIRKNGVFTAIIFIFAGILASSFLLLNLLLPDIFVILIPFIVLPILFSFQRAIIALREANQLTFKMFFKGFISYYQERFRSNYSALGAMLKIFLTYFISSFVTILVITLSFYHTNFLNFQTMYADVVRIMTAGEDFSIIYDEYSYLIKAFSTAISIPPLSISTLLGFYWLSTRSHSLFMRFSALKASGSFITFTYSNFLKKYAKEFNGKYFYLNWPMYLIFVLAMGLGGFVGYLISFDSTVIYTFMLVFGIFVTFAIFGFAYFANKEALYFAFKDELESSVKSSHDEMLARFENNPYIKELLNKDNDEEKDYSDENK